PLVTRLASQPRPTLVLATGEHGESLGEHGERTHSLFAYEPTLRVPLIIAELPPGHPDTGAKPRAIDTAVRHVDLLPTILASAGAPVPAGLGGAPRIEPIPAGRGGERPTYLGAKSAAEPRGGAAL